MADSSVREQPKWAEPLLCPHCKNDLRDHKAGPPFKREIAQYSRERDMTVGYQCPDCGRGWAVADHVLGQRRFSVGPLPAWLKEVRGG